MDRNYTLDYLRATAALMVCICHFRHCLPEPFESIATEGHIGVQIFFVISGYVIPFTMAKGGYQLRSMGNFWLKRIARLHPPYLAALLITFAVSASASIVHGAGLSFSHWDVLKSAFYLWIPAENPVIWTLIIELKYYLLIGLLFPLFFSQRHVLRRGGFLITLALAAFFVFKDHQFIPYFLLGFVVAYDKLELALQKRDCLTCPTGALRDLFIFEHHRNCGGSSDLSHHSVCYHSKMGAWFRARRNHLFTLFAPFPDRR